MLFNFSVIEQNNYFRANSVQNLKIVCFRWYFLSKLIGICRKYTAVQLFLSKTRNTLSQQFLTGWHLAFLYNSVISEQVSCGDRRLKRALKLYYASSLFKIRCHLYRLYKIYIIYQILCYFVLTLFKKHLSIKVFQKLSFAKKNMHSQNERKCFQKIKSVGKVWIDDYFNLEIWYSHCNVIVDIAYSKYGLLSGPKMLGNISLSR